MRKKLFTSIILLAVFFFLTAKLAIAQTESAVNKQLFEITRVGHLKIDKKKLLVKNKKFKIKIRSNYDMGNATIVVMLNGKKVKYEMKEIGTESVGAKVKVVTAVVYDIIANCKGLLRLGENELVIRGYGSPQTKVFKL